MLTAHSARVKKLPAQVDDPTQIMTTLDAIYRDDRALLVRMLHLKLGVREEAQDVAQEAFARLSGHADLAQIGDVRSYLFRVASNLATDRLRERQRRRERDRVDVTAIDLPDGDPSAERHIASRQEIARVRHALADLPERCRHAFVQHRFEARSYADIAQEMAVTESMVRKYVLRAVRHCIAVLSEDDADD